MSKRRADTLAQPSISALPRGCGSDRSAWNAARIAAKSDGEIHDLVTRRFLTTWRVLSTCQSNGYLTSLERSALDDIYLFQRWVDAQWDWTPCPNLSERTSGGEHFKE